VIRFDFDDRYVFETQEGGLPWLVRVLIADAAFYLIFLFFVFPWFALALLLWPHPKERQQAVEDHTPIVFMQPAEIPRALLRPQPSVPAKPAEKPPDHIVLPGNTKPFEAGPPPAPQPTKAPEQPASPAPPPPEPPRPEPESQIARNTAAPPPTTSTTRDDSQRQPVAGVLGKALQNLDRYAQQTQSSANPLGGATDPLESAIQFDRKGVNFDPWLRRFISQVKRNWFVPLAAQNFHGHVVLQFTIHKDGRITDVRVARASDIESFNRAAVDAIRGSNPTEPFPQEFPDEAAPFTVTFFYNERPGN
jgi:TonB family protein